MTRIGIIGHGEIGRPVLDAIDAGRVTNAECVSVLVRQPRTGSNTDGRVSADAAAFFATPMDLVVECAGHDAVREHGARALAAGADLMLISMGALADAVLLTALERTAKISAAKLIILSGAIGGLDILSAAAEDGLEAVTIAVSAPPTALRRSAAAKSMDLESLNTPRRVYHGPVREGATLYPGNVNIAAAVALAGIGLDRTILEVYADPTAARHGVTIEARGMFGSFRFTEDIPIDPDSTNSISPLVPMAVIKAIRHYAGTIVVGA